MTRFSQQVVLKFFGFIGFSEYALWLQSSLIFHNKKYEFLVDESSLFVEVAMINLMQRSLLVLCWHGGSATEFVEIQGL